MTEKLNQKTQKGRNKEQEQKQTKYKQVNKYIKDTRT